MKNTRYDYLASLGDMYRKIGVQRESKITHCVRRINNNEKFYDDKVENAYKNWVIYNEYLAARGAK